MPKYAVPLVTTAFTAVYVEAEHPDEAIELAYEAGTPTICAQCSGWGSYSDTGIELGEWQEDPGQEPWVVDE